MGEITGEKSLLCDNAGSPGHKAIPATTGLGGGELLGNAAGIAALPPGTQMTLSALLLTQQPPSPTDRSCEAQECAPVADDNACSALDASTIWQICPAKESCETSSSVNVDAVWRSRLKARRAMNS